MSTEFERIRWLSAYLETQKRGRGTVLGVGDDAAAWTPPAGHTTVLSVDVQNEDVHFRRRWFRSHELGRRAMAVSASDLAAMAAHPGTALVSLTLPGRTPESFFRGLFRGIVEEGQDYDLAVVGGNLARGPLSIAITVLGSAPARDLAKRSKARVGDSLFVTGFPGRAGIGRALLDKSDQSRRAAARVCKGAFRTPRARVHQALELCAKVAVHAMIDLSDGLGADLRHLMVASQKETALNATLDLSALESILDGPESAKDRNQRSTTATVADLARSMGLRPSEAALEGGEDYELLFAAPARAESQIKALGRRWNLPVTRIGTLGHGKSQEPNIYLRDGSGKCQRWKPRGFDHFASR